jgi:hypothetical protein
MASIADPTALYPTSSAVAGIFLLLAAAAWFAFPGMSIAIACYGACLVSEHVYRGYRSSISRAQRWLALFGLAIAWLVALTYVAAALPSNLSALI